MDRSDPVVDVHTLDRLNRLGGEGFVREMVGIFDSQGALRIRNTEACLAQGDLQAVRRHAHSLVSTAGNLGARRLQRLATMIEQAAESADLATLQDLVPHLSSEHAAAAAVLASHATEAAA